MFSRNCYVGFYGREMGAIVYYLLFCREAVYEKNSSSREAVITPLSHNDKTFQIIFSVGSKENDCNETGLRVNEAMRHGFRGCLIVSHDESNYVMRLNGVRDYDFICFGRLTWYLSLPAGYHAASKRPYWHYAYMEQSSIYIFGSRW